MQTLGILGGTFNPVHIGHLLLAETALQTVPLDRVLWVPNHTPPHRSAADLIAPQHRVEMVRRAIADHPQFTLADVEVDATAPGYAVDTFQHLQRMFPSPHQWFWIIGLDAFKSLPRWYRRQEWVTQCTWLVAPRRSQASDRITLEQLNVACSQIDSLMRQQGIAIAWRPLPMPQVDVSSSDLRTALRDRRSIRYLVPDSVRVYIRQHNVYPATVAQPD